MFFRAKQVGGRTYLQLVENRWRDGRTQQRVVATLGRLDKLIESGGLNKLIRSGTRLHNNSINYIKDPEETPLSSHQASKLLQVSPSTVVSWVNSGKLPAFRTPGGHRRIKLADLERFLTENQLPVPSQLEVPAIRSRVFIVDDEPLVIRAIQRSMAPHPEVEVDGCTDGIEALVQIGAWQPDLVLLDVHMEGIDGFEVCRRLRRIGRLSAVPIVAITAFPAEEDRSRIMNYGASDYWVKPIAAEAITKVLAERASQMQATG